MFRPLALAVAFAGGSIGLSSAEINYSFQEGEIVSTSAVSDADAPETVGVQLASKSECCISLASRQTISSSGSIL